MSAYKKGITTSLQHNTKIKGTLVEINQNMRLHVTINYLQLHLDIFATIS